MEFTDNHGALRGAPPAPGAQCPPPTTVTLSVRGEADLVGPSPVDKFMALVAVQAPALSEEATQTAGSPTTTVGRASPRTPRHATRGQRSPPLASPPPATCSYHSSTIPFIKLTFHVCVVPFA